MYETGKSHQGIMPEADVFGKQRSISTDNDGYADRSCLGGRKQKEDREEGSKKTPQEPAEMAIQRPLRRI
jgi:hypothetical protein